MKNHHGVYLLTELRLCCMRTYADFLHQCVIMSLISVKKKESNGLLREQKLKAAQFLVTKVHMELQIKSQRTGKTNFNPDTQAPPPLFDQVPNSTLEVISRPSSFFSHKNVTMQLELRDGFLTGIKNTSFLQQLQSQPLVSPVCNKEMQLCNITFTASSLCLYHDRGKLRLLSWQCLSKHIDSCFAVTSANAVNTSVQSRCF